MIPYAEDVLQVARTFIGYKEKRSNAYLDDFEKNAGSANITKFQRDTKGFWGDKQGAEWCTTYVLYCLMMASYQTPAQAKADGWKDVKAIQPYTKWGASCYYQTEKYKSVKRFYSEPKVGDQAFFKRGHTGIVEKYDGKTITLIEGNSNNKVERRVYSFPNSIFSGFGRPYYAVKAQPSVAKTHKVTPTDTPERIARKYGITPQELIEANREKYPKITIDFIRDGWELIIPEHKEAFKPYSTTTDAEKGLNVRAGAGTSYKILGILPFGSKVTILEKNGKWGRINYNSKTGWIALQYTK